jgi:Dihydrodipicolinate reductase, C-terminus
MINTKSAIFESVSMSRCAIIVHQYQCTIASRHSVPLDNKSVCSAQHAAGVHLHWCPPPLLLHTLQAFGVPEEHLRGHAFHTYSLTSDDGTVEFQFRHNVCGRRMYADGTADAVEFLAKQIRAGADRKVYNMIDVLKMGGI